MKALAAVLIVALLSYSGPARSQDGAHGHTPDPRIDDLAAENDAQDAAIERNAAVSAENAAGLAERAEVDRAIGQEVIEIKARLDAAEAQIEALKKKPDPEPETIPVYSVGPSQELTPVASESVTVTGPFTICLLGEDASGPVVFSWDGGGETENQPAYCMFGGNEAPFELRELPAGETAVEITAGDAEPFTIRIVVENKAPIPPPVTRDGTALMQVGPWVPTYYNLEEPYINLIYASDTFWKSKNFDSAALWKGGFLSEKTGLPTSLPNGETMTHGSAFFPQVKGAPLDAWDGSWIVDWQTEDGNCSADINLQYLERELITKAEPCRIEFTRDKAGGRTQWHVQFQVTRLDSPLTSLRVYRAENEAAIKAGRIYSPRFCEAVKGYDVIRDMDLSQTNKAGVRFVEQQATMEAGHWNNFEWLVRDKAPAPFRGKPLEATFRMGVECDAMVWAHAPLTLGSPVDIYAPEIYDADAAVWLTNISDAVAAKAKDILASDEWDRYADQFVSALIKSGYPENDTLYVTLANEVWNYAGAYNYTTRYAGGLGKGLGQNGRYAYGALSARFKLALERALERAGRNQVIEYVLEGQTANVATTRDALQGMKAYLEQSGETWADHAGEAGVSIASYWGVNETQMTRAGVDPNDLEALEDYIVNGPENDIYTLAFNVKFWGLHAEAAEKFGVKLTGAYEGGSHFTRPKAMTQENYEAFMWGEAGARVNTAVNRALAEAFPGVILSNYVLAGPPGGQPWFEGPLGAKTPMNDSWNTLISEN